MRGVVLYFVQVLGKGREFSLVQVVANAMISQAHLSRFLKLQQVYTSQHKISLCLNTKAIESCSIANVYFFLNHRYEMIDPYTQR